MQGPHPPCICRCTLVQPHEHLAQPLLWKHAHGLCCGIGLEADLVVPCVVPFCFLSIWRSAGDLHKHKGFCVLVCVVVSCCIVVCIAAALCGAMGHWNVTPMGGKGVPFLHCQHQCKSRLIECCSFSHTYSCAFFYTFGCACLLPLHMVVLMSVHSLQEKPFTV